MAPSNDMLNAHVVRLRFFRLLVVAALLLLGTCALLWPLGGRKDRHLAARVAGGLAEHPGDLADERRAGPNTDQVFDASRHRIGQDNAAMEVVAQGLVFQMASGAGRRVSKTAVKRSVLFNSASDLLLRHVPRGTAHDRSKAEQPQPELLTAAVEQPPSQPAVSSPAPLATPDPRPARVVLLNPAATGVDIHFVVDHEVHALASGKAHNLRGEKETWLIRFHRGKESVDEARYHLSEGTFSFGATEDGWVLDRADAPEEPRD